MSDKIPTTDSEKKPKKKIGIAEVATGIVTGYAGGLAGAIGVANYYDAKIEDALDAHEQHKPVVPAATAENLAEREAAEAARKSWQTARKRIPNNVTHGLDSKMGNANLLTAPFIMFKEGNWKVKTTIGASMAATAFLAAWGVHAFRNRHKKEKAENFAGQVDAERAAAAEKPKERE